MILLTLFAFLGGVVTILSPCILPILPIILSSSLTGGKKRPLGVVAGFVVSFTFFTLFLSYLVKLVGISADSLRSFSIIVILVFGVSLLAPKFQELVEKLFARLSSLYPKVNGGSGFLGGVLVGLSIGLLWTPCVGPILASIISLAIAGTVNSQAIIITFAHALGTAIPMLGIVWGGRNLLNKVPNLVRNTVNIQKGFGVLMIITAIAIYFNFDRTFQVYILDKFPSYGTGLTQLEDNSIVKNALESFKTGDRQLTTPEDMGKPSFQIRNGGPTAPEIIPGGVWFNTSTSSIQALPELAQNGEVIESLRGKVVLIDFWTYTCINCIRTLPYLRDWHEKYKDKGLVIIGVHTPEFEFEKEADNVKKAVEDFELKYPIVQDNNYATWRAYNNRYWPAKYLIDKNGLIRYTHFGEGDYDKTEKAIQELLEETGENVSDVEINTSINSVAARTPELYIGSDRYVAGFMDFKGKWTDYGQYKVGAPPDTSLVLNFNAKDVYLVMRPYRSIAQVEIYLDGQKIRPEDSGLDVKGSKVELILQKAYHLVRLQNPGIHKLEIKLIDVFGVEFYAFTFG